MFFGYGASLLVDDFYGWNVPVTGTFVFIKVAGVRQSATMPLLWYYYGNGMVL